MRAKQPAIYGATVDVVDWNDGTFRWEVTCSKWHPPIKNDCEVFSFDGGSDIYEILRNAAPGDIQKLPEEDRFRWLAGRRLLLQFPPDALGDEKEMPVCTFLRLAPVGARDAIKLPGHKDGQPVGYFNAGVEYTGRIETVWEYAGYYYVEIGDIQPPSNDEEDPHLFRLDPSSEQWKTLNLGSSLEVTNLMLLGRKITVVFDERYYAEDTWDRIPTRVELHD